MQPTSSLLPRPGAPTRIIQARCLGADPQAVADGLIGPGRDALVAVSELCQRGGGRVVLVADSGEGFVAFGLRRLVECLDQAGATSATRVFMTIGTRQLGRITAGEYDAAAGRLIDDAGAAHGVLRIGGGRW